MRTAIRKRKAERVDTAPALRDRVERQLSAAANAKPSSHNDPLYSVTETFQQEFQRIGRERAESEEEQERERLEAEKRPEQPELSQGKAEKGAERPEQKARKPGTPPKAEERTNAAQERTDAAPMRKFSKMAFQRGELSAALLEGTGKLALVSCLKRAVGKTERSATLFGLGAQTQNVPSRDPNKMMFHRNFANGAVGLVVDALRDARQTVESLTDMAAGTGEFRERDGGATLQAMYPFLDDSRERELLAERRERLKGDCTTEERAILENAAVRAEALIAKKARMKEDFIQKLREVSDRAAQALAELEAPETLEEIAEALTEADGQSPPPDAEPPEAEISGDFSIDDNAEISDGFWMDGDAEETATVEISEGFSMDDNAEETATVEISDSFSMDGDAEISGDFSIDDNAEISEENGAETSESAGISEDFSMNGGEWTPDFSDAPE